MKQESRMNYSCLALLGLAGEDKLRPYEFNHDWCSSCRGRPCLPGEILPVRAFHWVSAHVQEGE